MGSGIPAKHLQFKGEIGQVTLTREGMDSSLDKYYITLLVVHLQMSPASA